MRDSFFGFVTHVGKAKGFASNFAIAGVDHEMMFFTKFPRQLQDVDFRTDVPALEVPVYVLDGAHELASRRDLALEWFEALSAPHKEWITYEDAGHSVVFEEADAFHRLMTESIVPATYRE